MRDDLADFIRLHARDAARHHTSTRDLLFASDTLGDAVRHGVRLLAADRKWDAAGLGFHDCATGLNGHLASALFGDLSADLVRDALRDLFTHHATGPNGNLLDDLLRDDAANLNGDLRHDGLGDLATDGDGNCLAADFGLISRAGDLALDDVRAPLRAERVEAAWLHCPA